MDAVSLAQAVAQLHDLRERLAAAEQQNEAFSADLRSRDAKIAVLERAAVEAAQIYADASGAAATRLASVAAERTAANGRAEKANAERVALSDALQIATRERDEQKMEIGRLDGLMREALAERDAALPERGRADKAEAQLRQVAAERDAALAERDTGDQSEELTQSRDAAAAATAALAAANAERAVLHDQLAAAATARAGDVEDAEGRAAAARAQADAIAEKWQAADREHATTVAALSQRVAELAALAGDRAELSQSCEELGRRLADAEAARDILLRDAETAATQAGAARDAAAADIAEKTALCQTSVDALETELAALRAVQRDTLVAAEARAGAAETAAETAARNAAVWAAKFDALYGEAEPGSGIVACPGYQTEDGRRHDTLEAARQHQRLCDADAITTAARAGAGLPAAVMTRLGKIAQVADD